MWLWDDISEILPPPPCLQYCFEMEFLHHHQPVLCTCPEQGTVLSLEDTKAQRTLSLLLEFSQESVGRELQRKWQWPCEVWVVRESTRLGGWWCVVGQGYVNVGMGSLWVFVGGFLARGYAFNTYLLSFYSVAGTVLNNGGTVMMWMNTDPGLVELTA